MASPGVFSTLQTAEIGMRNLADFLVHFFGRAGTTETPRLSVVHDRCLYCDEQISDSQSYATFRVCPFCRFHYTITARQRIDLLTDRGTFKETHKYLSSVAPLSFSRRGRYGEMLARDQNRTGLTEAAVTGRCKIEGDDAMLIVLDFTFMGGTMGSVVGEKVASALEAAAKRNIPAVAVVSGGGIRIQEGVLSLMQMAKTVTAANRLRDEGAPFIVVLANPSTGQAYASFANLADIILAEPKSLIGLSPLRTLREASNIPLPLDAHTAEAHVGHGLLDNVIDRESMRTRLSTLIRILQGQRQESKKQDKQEKEQQAEVIKALGRECQNINPWNALTAVRSAERPVASTYLRQMLEPFIELRGDRLNSDDRSIVAGIGYLKGQPVAVIAQQRRPLVEGERYHVYPDGLRKAQRLIALASRFELPLVTLVDTQGADPGLEAEEQGIGNAIARTLSAMLDVPNPIVSVIIGEGGSEGALALGIADAILMQEYAVYSPISMNHNLAGTFHEPALDREAADALMLTAYDCVELGIADKIIPEPIGGSHLDPRAAGSALQAGILREFTRLNKMSQSKLLKRRYAKFRRMGEASDYSQEAMTREVELLMSITAGERTATAPVRGREPEPSEAYGLTTDDQTP